MTNKTKKSFFAFLMTCLMVFSTIMIAFATDTNPSATFGSDQIMYFKPGSTYTTTDLFPSFKGVMPGDKLTETIFVKNEYSGPVRIYLKAEPHDDADMKAFLSQLTMTVTNENSGEEIFKGSPAEAGQLENHVLLGKVYRKQEITLMVRLEVPIEMDNTYAGKIGEVDWIFTIEDAPSPTSDDDEPPSRDPKKPGEVLPDTTVIITDEDVPLAAAPDDLPFGVLPATGDTTAIVPYLCMLAVGICGLFITLIAGRRKKKEQ